MSLVSNKAKNVAYLFDPDAMVAPAALGFQPNKAQERARKAVMQLIDEGARTPGHWIDRFREESLETGKKPTMSGEEWREWRRQTGFLEWFYNGLYLQITEHELVALDVVFFYGLERAMTDGNAQALRLYADMRGMMEQKSEGSGIQDFLRRPTGAFHSEDSGKGWKSDE